ncbi:aliphatic sulfonate ABC transporter permease SsuC [Aneurinibacillus sp. Ricciae_BoGa-3]|uniref:aliphatic sulfonate ABC transporter permease SsuC n=1 Tax=Aneurinibacillus sp. Ricciae_BoGa-3 TaxID=3022697 RepID=UPI0023415930|nr:aliphatic sulfonate ABC transporter permease SsuC [Aneurinibacillus sp. Ricciae_BoGa-3]WCK54065.1 aliphatic sulfonate ABC transporter permease SsuC [Aneurinibacillus sp. Ricciae_BoGa-3]
MKKTVHKRISDLILPWMLPLLVLIGWQAAAWSGWLSSGILSSPFDVLRAAFRLIKTGELFQYIGISSQRAFIGFAIGDSIGLLLGLLTGLFSIAEKLFDTSVQMLRNIPHLALIPLVIVWFGIEEEAKLFLVALGVLFPVYLNTFHGIRTVDAKLIEMGRIYGLRGFALFRHIIFPAALPSILVGIRFALGIMWVTLIVAETISANSGIGYMAMNAREFMQIDVVIVSILLYALLGKLSDSIAKLVEKRFLQWNPSYRKSRA